MITAGIDTSKFVNTSKPIDRSNRLDADRPGAYDFDRPPRLLFVWSRLFQSVISQAGSFIASKKFHNHECGIYKCEGGCRIEGWGDLVLLAYAAYNDYGGRGTKDKVLPKLANLITHVVLEWNPLDPIESMLNTASKVAKCDKEELRKAIEESPNGTIFGGNALSDFFSWNPFSEPPIDEDYEKWCLINISGDTEADVDQMQSDRHLGKRYLAEMKELVHKAAKGQYVSAPMCCSPSRSENGLRFWINTGRSTQIDGWKTEEEILEFLKSDGILVHKER